MDSAWWRSIVDGKRCSPTLCASRSVAVLRSVGENHWYPVTVARRVARTGVATSDGSVTRSGLHLHKVVDHAHAVAPLQNPVMLLGATAMPRRHDQRGVASGGHRLNRAPTCPEYAGSTSEASAGFVGVDSGRRRSTGRRGVVKLRRGTTRGTKRRHRDAVRGAS